MATPEEGSDDQQYYTDQKVIKASNDLLNDIDCSEYLAKQADALYSNSGDNPAGSAVSTQQAGAGAASGPGDTTVQVWLGDAPPPSSVEPQTTDRADEDDQQQQAIPERGHESNDLLYHLCIDQIVTDDTTYSCVPSLSQDARGKVVPYEYNIHVLEDDDEDGGSGVKSVEERTVEMEGKMVKYLAEKLGLADCPSSRAQGRNLGLDSESLSSFVERRKPERRSLVGQQKQQLRRREQQDAGEVQNQNQAPSSIVGISSEPWDMVDRSTECKSHNLGIPSRCVHMKGSFAAYFARDTSDETITLEIRNILDLIQQGMRTDKFKTESIPIAVYTGPLPKEYGADDEEDKKKVISSDDFTYEKSPTDGNHIDPTIASSNEAQQSSSGGGGGVSPMILGIVGAVALIVIIVAAVFVRRRRQRDGGAGEGGGGKKRFSSLSSKKKQRGGTDSDDRSEDRFSHVDLEGNNGLEVTLGDTYPTANDGNKNKNGDGQVTATPSDDGHDTLPTRSGSGSYDHSDEGHDSASSARSPGGNSHGGTSNQSSNRAVDGSHGGGSRSRSYRSFDGQKNGSTKQVSAVPASPTTPVTVASTVGGGSANSKTRSYDNSHNDDHRDGSYDEDSSVSSEESGVTIELDMARVNSTVSDITWIGPNPSIKNQYPPYRSIYTQGGNQQRGNMLPPAINEVDSKDYDEVDEDPLVLVGSVDRTRTPARSRR